MRPSLAGRSLAAIFHTTVCPTPLWLARRCHNISERPDGAACWFTEGILFPSYPLTYISELFSIHHAGDALCKCNSADPNCASLAGSWVILLSNGIEALHVAPCRPNSEREMILTIN
ncbi:hypothetical protein EVAR_44318_1 [Eumeta japonica]|uniref:Uncharacterized protein n=1 Tax=Eumeta variegata TaxID=151549 RepID=A0A4C1X7I0_EUMVA|nr:hypothetical protein EVAR_44318_1 [Eumeta japonica]